jgi:hypothetical protein
MASRPAIDIFDLHLVGGWHAGMMTLINRTHESWAIAHDDSLPGLRESNDIGYHVTSIFLLFYWYLIPHLHCH